MMAAIDRDQWGANFAPPAPIGAMTTYLVSFDPERPGGRFDSLDAALEHINDQDLGPDDVWVIGERHPDGGIKIVATSELPEARS